MTDFTVLGIETSCDETAAAVVRLKAANAPNQAGQIHSNVILSQIDEHAPFGGVVPEIAARSHISALDGIVKQALDDAKMRLTDMDAIAATAGPGLIGGVMVGLVTGKSLAMAAQLPFIGVNHLEAHALTVRLSGKLAFPYLLLLVSGGHCQLIGVEALGQYTLYGTTLDDAAGEAFDKAAKLMGLAYPGGPEIERVARAGDANAINLPRPMTGDGGCDFSFSGLKTALRLRAEKMQPVNDADIANLASAFQTSVVDCLTERSENAMQKFAPKYQGRQTYQAGQVHQGSQAHQGGLNFVIAGGVAANQYLRERFEKTCAAQGFALHVAPPALCTDNAAMIAWAGAERLARGQDDGYDMAPRARWSLSDLTPPLAMPRPSAPK